MPVTRPTVAQVEHWEESTIYRAAHAFEQAGDWRQA